MSCGFIIRSWLVLVALAATNPASAAELRIGTWNIANLHHEEGVPLRPGAQARDAEDFGRLRGYAASLNLDIIALQEIGSPQALARIFPESDYHLVMSARYRSGDELRPPAERDIYTALAIRKARFPAAPTVEMVEALSLLHVGFDRDGTPSARPTRMAMALTLRADGKEIKVLNVHLKSACHQNSLSPVFDTRRDGAVIGTRFDCRTLAAQAMILESWIEQQAQLGRSVIMLGDFNRRFNRFDDTPGRHDHFWQMINDGAPRGLDLRKGPPGKNTTCWPAPHAMFFDEHIDFVVFDSGLDSMLAPERIAKVALPFQDDPKYAGQQGGRLSDHCPVVATLETDGPVVME